MIFENLNVLALGTVEFCNDNELGASMEAENLIIHNRKGVFTITNEKTVISGNSNVDLAFLSGRGSYLAVWENAKAVITAKDYQVIEVHLLHNAQVYLDAGDNSIIFVKNHSPETAKIIKSISGQGRIIEIR